MYYQLRQSQQGCTPGRRAGTSDAINSCRAHQLGSGLQLRVDTPTYAHMHTHTKLEKNVTTWCLGPSIQVYLGARMEGKLVDIWLVSLPSKVRSRLSNKRGVSGRTERMSWLHTKICTHWLLLKPHSLT
jgi:hypothetical protein